MTYYIGNENNLTDILGANNPRFFYALRRDDDGQVFFAKVDQLSGNESISINNPGLSENNYKEFEYGTDFFDGRIESDHSRPFSNLAWDQYRWDARNVYYYINDNGEFVVRINQEYIYSPDNIINV